MLSCGIKKSSSARRGLPAAQDFIFDSVCATSAAVICGGHHAALRAAPKSDSLVWFAVSSSKGRGKKQSVFGARTTRRRNESFSAILRPHDRRAIRRTVPDQRADQDRRHRGHASPLGLM